MIGTYTAKKFIRKLDRGFSLSKDLVLRMGFRIFGSKFFDKKTFVFH